MPADTYTVTRVCEHGADVPVKFGWKAVAEHHIATMRFLDKALGIDAIYDVTESSDAPEASAPSSSERGERSPDG